MRLLLGLALLLAACRPTGGPFPGDTYEDPTTGAAVQVVATGLCPDVREEVPGMRGGLLDTAAVRGVEDRTRREAGDPSSCVAFSAAPGEIVITSRTAFLDEFELVEELVPVD